MTRWLDVARKYDGLQEVKGKGANPVILGWLQNEGKGGKGIKDDVTPWCGAGMAGVFTEAGLAHIIPKTPLRAKSWAKAGVPLDEPRVGCIVVLPRYDPKNPDAAHVGLLEAFTATTLSIRGANQKDRFGVDEFRRLEEDGSDRALAYRWPVPIKTAEELAADGSRIASRSKRVTRDTKIATGTGTAPETVPAVSATLPRPTAGLRETLEGLAGDVSWLKGILATAGDFVAFLGLRWPVAAVCVAAYFGARVLWDSYLIRQARVEDANEGYTAP